MITNHAPVFVAHVRPNRQSPMNALLAVFQHGLHHIGIALSLQHIEQRMQGAISVPQRKDGVVGESFGLMNIVVKAAILAVNIHINGRINHRVVQRSVKHGFLVFSSFSIDDG